MRPRGIWPTASRRCGHLALVGCTATLLSVGSPAAGAVDSAPVLPTIVLVHGAWADTSSWAAVLADLHADGYRTVVPTLHLTSLANDVATVRNAMNGVTGMKVLVAHSYGGEVASVASAGRHDVQALVHSAAFVPAPGDSILTLGSGYQQSAAFKHLAFTGLPLASPAYIAPNYFTRYFAQDLPPADAALLDAAQQPLNFSIVATPAGQVGWRAIPSWYAVSRADLMVDPAEELHMAQRAHAHIVDFADASHVGGITRYATQFTELIEQAVLATSH